MDQLIVNILFTASNILLVSVGFFIIYKPAKFFHFAHAAIIASGAYVSLAFLSWFHYPLIVSIVMGVIASGFLGWLMHRLVFYPMRCLGASSLIMLLASLGLYVVLQNIISLVFGDDTNMLLGSAIARGVDVLGAKLTYIQITSVIIALVVFVSLLNIFKRSKVGLSLHAIAANSGLAEISGINFERALGFSFFLGSCLAGISGIMYALDIGMTPTMGLSSLLMAVVAVIIGGVRNLQGIALGALLLSTAQHLAIWKLGSQWQDAVAFVILLAFLIFRPQGFFGKSIKKASV